MNAEMETILDAISLQVFDCHYDQLDKEWEKKAIIRRYEEWLAKGLITVVKKI